MLECTLYISHRDKFQSLFEKVVLGILKPFFQLDMQCPPTVSSPCPHVRLVLERTKVAVNTCTHLHS